MLFFLCDYVIFKNAMHSKGINVRYLGLVLYYVVNHPERRDLVLLNIAARAFKLIINDGLRKRRGKSKEEMKQYIEGELIKLIGGDTQLWKGKQKAGVMTFKDIATKAEDRYFDHLKVPVSCTFNASITDMQSNLLSSDEKKSALLKEVCNFLGMKLDEKGAVVQVWFMYLFM